MSVMFLTVKPFSTKTWKLKSVLGGAVGLALWTAIIYMIFVAQGMGKPSMVPSVVHNTAELAVFLASLAMILRCAGWLSWKVILRFRQYPGRCTGAAIVWIGIHYCYVRSDLTKEKFGLMFFTVAGGLAFILIASEVFGSVERQARKEGADEERNRAYLAATPKPPREIPVGHRPEDLD